MSGSVCIGSGGVRFDHINPAGFALLWALGCVAKAGAEIVITSGTDGEHSGPNDPHHSGEAYDVRSHNFDDAAKSQFLQVVLGQFGEVQPAYGGGYVTDKFFGWLEQAGTANEHFHFQLRHGQQYP